MPSFVKTETASCFPASLLTVASRRLSPRDYYTVLHWESPLLLAIWLKNHSVTLTSSRFEYTIPQYAPILVCPGHCRWWEKRGTLLRYFWVSLGDCAKQCPENSLGDCAKQCPENEWMDGSQHSDFFQLHWLSIIFFFANSPNASRIIGESMIALR